MLILRDVVFADDTHNHEFPLHKSVHRDERLQERVGTIGIGRIDSDVADILTVSLSELNDAHDDTANRNANNQCDNMDLRARHIKGVMEEGKALIKGEERAATAGTKARIKSMFNLMLDYALEYEIVEKNYARTFDVSGDIIREREESKRGHIPYSDDELQKLWDNVENMTWVDVILIQCYSGWRPQELGLLEVAHVNIADWTFVGGMKTEAGTNRIVPIHSRIRPLVKRRYDEAIALGSKYLINCTDTHTHRSSNMLTYDKYQQRYNKLRDVLGLNPMHRAHDGRNHFITKAKKYGVDEYAIKYMVGHAISDVTEKVYTKREIEWLQTEIEKIR